MQLVQIAPPSRTDVPAYVDLHHELTGLAGEILGKYGDLEWQPLVYVERQLDRPVLMPLYQRGWPGYALRGMRRINRAQDPADPAYWCCRGLQGSLPARWCAVARSAKWHKPCCRRYQYSCQTRCALQRVGAVRPDMKAGGVPKI